MIIKRMYATYGQLVADEVTKKTIIRIFEKHDVSEDVYNSILDPYNDIIVMNTDMGSCIPRDAYQEMRQAFEDLDKTNPYDNGLTYRDANNVFMLPSRKGSAILQILYCKRAEMPSIIVQVIAFEYKNGEMFFIEPWETGTITI